MDSDDRNSSETSDEPVRKRLRIEIEPEQIVGITEFLSHHDGFDGIIKYRYSDFLVNEISADGNIVRLTDLSCPDYNKNQSQNLDNVPLNDETIERLKNLSVQRSNERILIPANKCQYRLTKGTLTKDERTAIHHFVRSIDGNLKSELINNSIEVIYQTHGSQSRRSNEQWPDKTKPYLKFVLYKENRDTMDAIQCLASSINMNTALFQYAGIKDKRGKTCQEITIHKVFPTRFKSVNQRLPSIKVGNFQLCANPLRLGQLQGNRFEIFVRNLSIKSNETIGNYVEQWSEKGFINYFGLQRFGSRTSATQTVGKYLLQHDWSRAINTILAYDDGIKQDWLRQLLHEWNEKRDIKTILDGHLTYRRCLEVDLLRGLERQGEKNPIGVLSFLPRNTRLLYLHAYQSMIWNRIVSKRIQTYAMEILVGDLYVKNVHYDIDENPEIDFVTETNRTNIKLEQVVLPLPGHDVKYPTNEIHQWYRDMLNQDGIDIDQMKYHIKDYSLPGQYRKFIVRPGQVEWRLVHYDEINDDPLQSDYDRLMKHENNLSNTLNTYTGLILAFSLAKSSYATMALRELLHRNESKLQTNHDPSTNENRTKDLSVDQTAPSLDDENDDNEEMTDLVV